MQYINILGYGNTTKRMVELLAIFNYRCNIFNEVNTFTAPNIQSMCPNRSHDITKSKDMESNNFYCFSELEDLDSKIFLNTAIISPGISPHKPYLKCFKNIISEYDFIYYLIFLLKNNAKEIFNLHNLTLEKMKQYYFLDKSFFSIWVSGSNGKTTATQMLYCLTQNLDKIKSDHMYFNDNLDSKYGGNIGIPLAELLISELSKDIKDLESKVLDHSSLQIFLEKINFKHKKIFWILETSSFSLHYTHLALPNAYLLLNISPDHISWHGGFEEYKSAKLKALKRMKGRVALIPDEFRDEISNDNKDELMTLESKSQYLYFFKNLAQLVHDFDIEKSVLDLFPHPFNLNLALCISLLELSSIQFNLNNIYSYRIGDYKIQEVKRMDNLVFVNDSKGTNPDATINAIKRYLDSKNLAKSQIYLILGGDSKGANFEGLVKIIKDNNIFTFCIGVDGQKICKMLEKDSTYCHTLENALQEIKRQVENMQQRCIIMLSPACASLDQFRSYKHRGDEFNGLISKIFKEKR